MPILSVRISHLLKYFVPSTLRKLLFENPREIRKVKWHVNNRTAAHKRKSWTCGQEYIVPRKKKDFTIPGGFSTTLHESIRFDEPKGVYGS